jgi:hypothetical protein
MMAEMLTHTWSVGASTLKLRLAGISRSLSLTIPKRPASCWKPLDSRALMRGVPAPGGAGWAVAPCVITKKSYLALIGDRKLQMKTHASKLTCRITVHSSSQEKRQLLHTIIVTSMHERSRRYHS